MQSLNLLGKTKASIVTLLLSKGRTAGQIASTLGIQVSAVRKHLDQLSEQEIVLGSFERSNLGRPKKVYTLTSNGKELFPRLYDSVLNATIAKLSEEKGESYAESILNSVADDIADNKGQSGSRAFAKTLDELGFQSSVRDMHGAYHVTSRNCPLLRTAEAHGEVLCRGLHEELLRRGLGGSKVKREKWIISGDEICTHVVRKHKPA
jgi:predicted ArsR family transcriptional regulator